MDVDYGSRTSTCKLSGEAFVKGEVRLLFKSGDKTNFVKPVVALPFIETVVETCREKPLPGSKKRKAGGVWSPEVMAGWIELDEEHRLVLQDAYRDCGGGGEGLLLVGSLVRSDVKPVKRKNNTAGKKGAPTTKRSMKMEEDSEEEEGEDTEEDTEEEEDNGKQDENDSGQEEEEEG